MIQTVNDRWLQENVLQANSKPALVYVTGEMDAISRQNLHTLERISEAHPKLAVVAVDATAEFAATYQVIFVPTLFLFRRGNLHSTMGGLLPAEDMLKRAPEWAKLSSAELLAEEIERQQRMG